MRYLLPLLIFLPGIADAQGQPRDFADVVNVFVGLIDLLIAVIFSITFIVLIWTVINTWIIKGGDPIEVQKGKTVITVGVIVLVVMSGIWGIISLLRAGVFGL